MLVQHVDDALNPVRAHLVKRADAWRWSSVHAHLDPGRGDGITDTAPVVQRVPDFAALVDAGEDEGRSLALRRSESIGRTLGSEAFLDRIMAETGREPRPGKRGPKPSREV